MIEQLKPELESAIRARAYQIWEDEGRPNGRHDLHWQRAYEAIASSAAGSADIPVLTVAENVALTDGNDAKLSKQTTGKAPRAKADQAKGKKK